MIPHNYVFDVRLFVHVFSNETALNGNIAAVT